MITLALFSKEKHEPIKLQKIEIGAKFENLNKIGPMSPSLPPDFFYAVKQNILSIRLAYNHSTSHTPQKQYSFTD